MTYKVGAKGQVVLPKELRDDLGIRPGDEVVFDKGEHEIVVRKARSRSEIVNELRGALRDARLDLVAELEAEHRREVEDDEREMRRRGLR
ncbi:MAG TPA: AbrB/MazE/SpoVT family DNA-binding domain-containing protein [Conexibacter sp.]|nr:AbrB/MazE/SpoVT family DNA-binding domain-containing protein [Conexibacter sp.]